MKIYAFILIMSAFNTLYGATHHVGAGENYVTPHALYLAQVVQEGDTILIKGGDYTGQEALAVWMPDNLVIRGTDGRPHLIANGQYIWGKGIWVLGGDNITVENIEFSGATVPDKNGAGIRLDGSGLTVRNCYFHNNENGILTNNTYEGEIVIEHSEFEGGGYGDGLSHNIYIGHNARLVFQYNYVHGADVGHNLKTRAEENIIRYNRIMDEQSGNSSRLIDIPNGGFTVVMGNLLMQGPEAPNYNMIGYGLEGVINTMSDLYVINNTFVSERSNALFLHIDPATSFIDISNNIFAGKGSLTLDDVTLDVELGNVLSENFEDFDFENLGAYDYMINDNSIALNQGEIKTTANGYSLVPSHQYIHPMQYMVRPQGIMGIDAGAYELTEPSAIDDEDSICFNVYPNPGDESFSIDVESSKFMEVRIYGTTGIELLRSYQKTISTHSLTPGIYHVEILLRDGRTAKQLWIKQ